MQAHFEEASKPAKIESGVDVNVIPLGERPLPSPLHCQIW